MEIRDYLIEIMNNDIIAKYLSDDDKRYISELYSLEEAAYDMAFKFENEKNKIAAVIFYNIVLKNSEIKSRKFADSKSYVFTGKNIARNINISEKSFYKFNNLLYEKFPSLKEYSRKSTNDTHEDNEVINKSIEAIVSSLKKFRRKTEPQAVNQKNMVCIFNTNFEYIKYLYPDKSAIKIKEYLAHVQLNLFLAGHNVQEEKLESIFGEFARFLNFTLTDGRNDEDFVKVKDNYGRIENKVYIELGR